MHLEIKSNIKWLNYAVCTITTHILSLISDVRIKEKDLNQSWDLLVSSRFTFENFKEIMPIWFSNNQLDYFYTPTFRKSQLNTRMLSLD